MHITGVMSGFDGDPGVQYVELTMISAGQTLVADTRLTAFDADGSSHTVLIVTPSDVGNGEVGDRVLYGTVELATAAGVAPDFVVPAGILVPGGMVCWGAPGITPPDPAGWDPADPSQYVDCLAYGGYTGPTLASAGTPTQLELGDGRRALVRVGSADDNAADFELRTPQPCNNGGECGTLGGGTTTTIAGSSTTTTAPTTSLVPQSCGDADGNLAIAASDALLALLTAVGSAACLFCVCDVNGLGGITATDALLILQVAVGQPVALSCAAC